MINTFTIKTVQLIVRCQFGEFFYLTCSSIVLIDGVNPNGSISVRNACRQKTPDGKPEVVKGYAFRPDENEQGRLKVVFPGILNVGGYCKLLKYIC